MRTIVGILVVLLAGVASGAPPQTMDFSSGVPADYFTLETAGSVRVSAVGNTQVMVVSDATACFQDVKVKPSAKYTLKLESAFTGAVESIEENPRFEIFTRLGQSGPHLPSREMRFYDTAGKPVGRSILCAMPFKNQRTYQDVFHTPSDAATVRISVASGIGVELVLSRLDITETKDEEALNVNPSFQLGPYNYSGWQNISAGGQLIQRDGKTIFDTKYGSTGQMIPLPEPGTYALSAKATSNGYNSVVIVRVYDAQGKELMQTSTRRYGPPTYFVLPRDAAYASFLVYSCLLEEVRLLRVGDENAIESLREK